MADPYSQLPSIDLVAPSTGYTGTSKSVIRLQAMAGDTDGALQGVEFSVNGEPLPTWNAYLDLNDSLPITDGSTITIDDGTGKSPVVFEVDFDEVVFGSGIPQLSQDGSNLLNDLSLEGNYTRFVDTQFLLEIDGVAGVNGATVDSFRWSKDGGLTFIREKVAISAGNSQTLEYGVQARFTSATGHRMGDSWSFIARPENHILSLPSAGVPAQALTNQIRDLLIEEVPAPPVANCPFLRAGQNSDDLNLYHSMDQHTWATLRWLPVWLMSRFWNTRTTWSAVCMPMGTPVHMVSPGGRRKAVFMSFMLQRWIR